MENVFIYAIGDGGATACLEGVHRDLVIPCLQGQAREDVLESLIVNGRCYLWGVPDRGENRAVWERMAPNDLVLAFRGRSVMGAGYVLNTIEPPRARLWQFLKRLFFYP